MMSATKKVVLLSGGLDSVAAFHWSLERGPVRAVAFSYGQPHRDAELFAAGATAERHRTRFDLCLLPELGRLNPAAGHDAHGVSLAFLPGRNSHFLTRAVMACATPGEPLTLVMGANVDDAAGFPDCRPAFFSAMETALSAALDGLCKVTIETPWIAMTKTDILRWCASRPEALADARESVSCYRGTRCGQCDACVLRARAFFEVGIEDGTALVVMHGGDPAREAAFRQ